MSIETILIILDTVFIFSFIITISLKTFFKKINENKIKQQEYLKAYMREQSRLYDELPEIGEPPKNTTPQQKISVMRRKNIPIKIKPVENICICGHDLTEHIYDGKAKACYHVIEKTLKGEEVFCDCNNYKDKSMLK